MKSVLIFTFLLSVAIISVTEIEAHEGMITLFSDRTASNCDADLPELQVYMASLFYIRGDGPEFAACCEFRLLKSSEGIIIGNLIFDPEHGTIISMGSLETGYTVAYHAGEQWWCEIGKDVIFLGTLPVYNIADPDSFCISVVGHPRGKNDDPAISVSSCAPGTILIYQVSGGTFVFNGECYSPENPFGNPVSVESSSWGAIKKLYND